MFDRKSDYALNKCEPKAIVYRTVADVYIHLTSEDFSSEEEFQRWKDWSDGDYHNTEKDTHLYSDRKIPLEDFQKDGATKSPEDTFINAAEHEWVYKLLLEALDACLTKTQRRRLLLHHVGGLTMRQIAGLEKTSYQNIAKSIRNGDKKLKKFLEKQGDKRPF